MPRYDLKAYTSLTARIPQDLADQVKRYALEHRCGLSELIRDGLEMRLEADTPWHAQGRSRAPDAEVLQEVLQEATSLQAVLGEVLQKVIHYTKGGSIRASILCQCAWSDRGITSASCPCAPSQRSYRRLTSVTLAVLRRSPKV